MKFSRNDQGSRWESFASQGIHVDNEFMIDDKPNNREGKGEPNRCQATEKATLTCPSPLLFPIIKWQFNKSHTSNLEKLQRYFSSQTASTGTYDKGINRLQ